MEIFTAKTGRKAKRLEATGLLYSDLEGCYS